MKVKQYHLIGAVDEVNPNPGDNLITKGIEYLISSYEQKKGNIAAINYVNIFDNKCMGWLRSKQSDVVVLCGTPQLGLNTPPHFSDKFYDQIRSLKGQGIKVVNLWPGFCHHNSKLHYSTNDEYKQVAIKTICKKHGEWVKKNFSLWDLIVPRDSITKGVLESLGIPSTQLIDCVSYARHYYNILPKEPKYNLVVYSSMYSSRKGDERFLQFLKGKQSTSDLPCFCLAHTHLDYKRLKSKVDNLVYISTPRSLAEFYSEANEVYSMRVHGSITAGSFEKKLLHISLDSRSDILQFPGVKTVGINDIDSSVTAEVVQRPAFIYSMDRDQTLFNCAFDSALRSPLD